MIMINDALFGQVRVVVDVADVARAIDSVASLDELSDLAV